jgi:hypothetical protein
VLEDVLGKNVVDELINKNDKKTNEMIRGIIKLATYDSAGLILKQK